MSREVKEVPRSSVWPRWSRSLGVLPSQQQEMVESARGHGLPTPEFDGQGRMKVNSPTHERKLMKWRKAPNGARMERLS